MLRSTLHVPGSVFFFYEQRDELLYCKIVVFIVCEKIKSVK